MRILQITAHATRGLSAAPAFVLNTASTHALSLAALWVPADRAYLRCLHARSRMYEEVVRSYAPPGAAAATATKGSGRGYGPADTTVDDALVSALDAYLAGTLTSSSQKGDEGGGGGDEEEEGDDGRSVLSKGTATRSRRRSAAFARYLQYPSLSDASPRLRSLTTPPPHTHTHARSPYHRLAKAAKLYAQRRASTYLAPAAGGDAGVYMYLAAGTHTGAVYVWRLGWAELESAAKGRRGGRHASRGGGGGEGDDATVVSAGTYATSYTHATHATHTTHATHASSIGDGEGGAAADDGKKVRIEGNPMHA